MAHPHLRTRSRKPIAPSVRFAVLNRDSFRCRYCGRAAPDVTLELDHVVPVSDGGWDGLDNLVAACWDCNRGKGRMAIHPTWSDEVESGQQAVTKPVPIVGLKPPKDGHWWVSAVYIDHRCVVCGEVSKDNPAVMSYRQDLDFFKDQDRIHPGWATKGWLVWWECLHCHADYPRSCTTATDRDIEMMGITRLAWRRQ